MDTSQENLDHQHQQLFNADQQATNIINNSRVSPLVSRHNHQIRAKKMEIDSCYEGRLVDGSCAQMDVHDSPGEMTRRTVGRRRKQRSQRQGRLRSINVTDFDQATEFLHHFHAITSRSLDVIHESNDLDDADESNIAREGQSPSHGLSAMRRTKTCSCLLEAQTSTTIGNHHGWFLENSNDDDEWGFYSEEFDPSWSTSTRTVNQGIAHLRH